MTSSTPRISVGLPTYNRASSLRLAVESVLAQDYDDFELIISDNGSTDETRALCEEFAARDPRVRYIAQPVNRGISFNFQATLSAARGELFMWLADDDWLSPSYFSSCMEALSGHDDYALVCGKTKYFRDGKFVMEEGGMSLLQTEASARVLVYYQRVVRNGAFYGIMRRSLLKSIEIQTILGGDWFFVAAVAFTGKIKMVETVSLNRSIAGSSENVEALARAEGHSGFFSNNPHLKIALTIFQDIAYRSPVYQSLGRLRRAALGAKAATEIFFRFCLPLWRYRWQTRLHGVVPAHKT
ncbi:MAG: hypothetical protein QOE33_2471 [Acidobacteriota bacterium]|nr:hypothetical protein [Acidobacteriota bacterium]